MLKISVDEFVTKLIKGERDFNKIWLRYGSDISHHPKYPELDRALKADATPVQLNMAVMLGARMLAIRLPKAEFSYAHLEAANFSGANLSDANFRCAYLLQTNFFGAELGRAHFERASLRNAYIEGARGLKTAHFGWGKSRAGMGDREHQIITSARP